MAHLPYTNWYIVEYLPNLHQTKYQILQAEFHMHHPKYQGFPEETRGGWGHAGKETLENNLLFLLECTLTFNTKYIIPNINLTILNQAR